ncbi:MAG: response regulator transcription factor [Bacteroidia bacterium]|nr:response regulator transcription factor [Bacteroidia bacterium]
MHKSYKILIADDEEDILEFLSYNLRKEGHIPFIATNGHEALKIALRERPDLIVLDIMMPGIDGIETCQLMRDHSELQNTIIVFLSAKNEDYTQIAGFGAGADDFIPKPVRPRLFITKINALLRRSGRENAASGTFRTSELFIDRDRFLLQVHGRTIDLPKKEFELISLLTSKPGKVFTREEILNLVWGRDIVVGGRTVDVHIRKLREKLGIERIKTIKGIGYKFAD